MAKAKPGFGQIVCVAILLLGAFCMGVSFRPQPVARAGVRDAIPPGHFLSGSERSVPLLKEISGTLRKIDARLSKIENMVALATERQDKR